MAEIVSQDVSSKMRNQTGRVGVDVSSLTNRFNDYRLTLRALKVGENDDTIRIQELFNGKGKIYFPKGNYTISSPITMYDKTDVECHPEAIFKLADNARCWMFKSQDTIKTGDFKWIGGVIDGNDENQGSETGQGTNHDISRAMVLIGFQKVEVGNLKVKSIRGHALNFWGCDSVYYHDIEIRQDLAPLESTLFPNGGSRRDGIDGSARVVVMKNIYGFTDDDFIALCPGCKWDSQTTTKVMEYVLLENIKFEKNSTDPTYSTFNGVGIYCYDTSCSIGMLTMDNVMGDLNIAFIRILGIVDTVRLSKINCTLNPKSPDSIRTSFIQIQAFNQSDTTSPSTIDQLSLSDVTYKSLASNMNLRMFLIKNSSTINYLRMKHVNNYQSSSIVYDSQFLYLSSNFIVYNYDLQAVTVKILGVTSNYPLIFRDETTNTPNDKSSTIVNVRGDLRKTNTLNSKSDVYRASSNDTMYSVIGNTLFVGSPTYLSPLARGNDFFINTQPRPNTDLLSSFIPGFEYCEIGAATATGYPNNSPGHLTTYKGISGDVFSYQIYRVRSSNAEYRRYWDVTNSVWTAWTKVTVV